MKVTLRYQYLSQVSVYIWKRDFFVVPVHWVEVVEVFVVVEVDGCDFVTVDLPSQQLLPTFLSCTLQ